MQQLLGQIAEDFSTFSVSALQDCFSSALSRFVLDRLAEHTDLLGGITQCQ